MIRFQPITTSEVQHYKFMEELLVESFPPEEYRELEHLREYTDRIGNFHKFVMLYFRCGDRLKSDHTVWVLSLTILFFVAIPGIAIPNVILYRVLYYISYMIL